MSRAGGVLVGLVLVATGCSLPDRADGPAPSESGDAVEEETADSVSVVSHVRRGTTGGASNRFDSTLRVDAVVGHTDRTVLRLTVSPEGEEGASVNALNAFAGGVLGEHVTSPLGFTVIDPVGQRIYVPAHSDSGFVGSRIAANTVVGAHYELEAHFAPLPAGTERVSLSTPGTQGVFTGIEVDDRFDQPWDPGEAPTEREPAPSDVVPGQTVTMPVSDGPVPEEGLDLYSIVESTEAVRETSFGEQRVDLDTDVLFEFDEDELTDEATATLDAVVAETREKADPDLPPITIVGHTDGRGGDAHNQALSESRARAVRDYLEEELGTAYTYESEGRGSSRPLLQEGGDDDEEARARNRRVEIAYNVAAEAEVVRDGAQETVSAVIGTGNTAAPADGAEPATEAVASGSAEVTVGFDYDFDLYSLRRDGAFVVAEIDLTNRSARTITHVHGAHFGAAGVQGGRFGGFGVEVPDTGDVYRSVRIGQARVDEEDPWLGTTLDRTPYVEPIGYPYLIDPGSTNRVNLYFPAPPLEVGSVTFRAGLFGDFEDVPLR
ncbi:OmpA family protein [Nocardiopsis sp. NPDC007018]|uniref:OmpA family protein n=1 Tax=Nocardiopsis sp. NPDC007018 TaxID=3155721 RepID=UPI0033D2CEBE